MSGVRREIQIAGFLVVACVVLVAYAPALGIGFLIRDDYTYLYWAGSMGLSQYLVSAFDPGVQRLFYRPLMLILIQLEYAFFGSEAGYYHVVQIMVHLANSLVVLGIIWQLSKRWRVALLGAILWAGLPVASEAVFWISDSSPLATFFSLTAVLFWVRFLKGKDKRDYFLAVGTLVLAFMSKESAVVVPIVFFIIDRILIREQTNALELVRRYSLVAFVLVAYSAIEYLVQLQGVLVKAEGYSFGEQVILNYAAYLTMLVFPWRLQQPSSDGVLLSVVGLSTSAVVVLKRNSITIIVFLVLCAVSAIGPVVFSSLGAWARYLYQATIPVVIVWTLGLELVWMRWKSAWLKVVISIVPACFVVLGASSTSIAASAWSETARQMRVPFRDVMRQHPRLPYNTRLYFIEPPFGPTISDVAGMFLLHYGTGISVGGTNEDNQLYLGGRLNGERANLRDYTTAYVYYFDENNRPIEVAVDEGAKSHIMPSCPCDFNVPIRLEGYEITSSTIQRNQPPVLILYWRAMGQIDKDYTVFVHLVDSSGHIVTGIDGMPRNGNERTSAWHSGQFTADAHVITVPQDAVAGSDYHLEVGLYYLPTMERLSIVDSHGARMTDKVAIVPFKVSR